MTPRVGGKEAPGGTYKTHQGPSDVLKTPDIVSRGLGAAGVAIPAAVGSKLSSRPFRLKEYENMTRRPQSELGVEEIIETEAPGAQAVYAGDEEVPSMDERKRLSRRQGEYRDAWRDSPRSFEEKEEERRGAQRRAIEEYLAQQDGKTPPKRFRKSGWR